MKEEIEKKMLEATKGIPYPSDAAKACAEVASSLLSEKEKEIAELKYKLEEESEARELVADYLFKHVSDKWLNKMVEELRAKTKLYHDTKIKP